MKMMYIYTGRQAAKLFLHGRTMEVLERETTDLQGKGPPL